MAPPADHADSPPSREGSGKARSHLDHYLSESGQAAPTRPGPINRFLQRPDFDLRGFWLSWHLEGGFDGLLNRGIGRSAIYSRIRRFRDITGQHPDDYEIPGVTLDLAAHQRDKSAR